MTVESLIAFNTVLMAAIASPCAGVLSFGKSCVASRCAVGIAAWVPRHASLRARYRGAKHILNRMATPLLGAFGQRLLFER